MTTRKPRLSIVHTGSKVAQEFLKPMGRSAKVSVEAADLMDDMRLTACQFGQTVAAADVQQQYVLMQMRFADLADYVSEIERKAGVKSLKVMKF